MNNPELERFLMDREYSTKVIRCRNCGEERWEGDFWEHHPETCKMNLLKKMEKHLKTIADKNNGEL